MAIAHKTIIAVASLYKGVLIFRTVDSFAIYNVLGERIPFSSIDEAESYVDSWSLAKTYSLS